LKRNGKYLATFRDPGGKQQWAEFRTKEEAKKWRARALLDPRSVASGKRTLNDTWEKFLEHHGAGLKRTSRENWEQEWRKHIGPALGGWPLGRITVLSLKDFMAELERRGVGAATRQKCRMILRRVLEEAVENGEVPSNPAAARGTRVKLPQPKRARVLEPVEVKNLAEAAAAISMESDALAIKVMCFFGLRIGEMAGLQARDIDEKACEITIVRTVSDTSGRLEVQDSTKTNRHRVLPVPSQLPVWAELLAHVRSRGLIGRAHVFQTANGHVIRPNNWRRRVWDRSMEKCDIPDPPSPHACRRTTASLLTSAGVPAPTVRTILGHSVLRQTGDYIDVPRADMESALSKLSQAIWG
jgi:integrase